MKLVRVEVAVAGDKDAEVVARLLLRPEDAPGAGPARKTLAEAALRHAPYTKQIARLMGRRAAEGASLCIAGFAAPAAWDGEAAVTAEWVLAQVSHGDVVRLTLPSGSTEKRTRRGKRAGKCRRRDGTLGSVRISWLELRATAASESDDEVEEDEAEAEGAGTDDDSWSPPSVRAGMAASGKRRRGGRGGDGSRHKRAALAAPVLRGPVECAVVSWGLLCAAVGGSALPLCRGVVSLPAAGSLAVRSEAGVVHDVAADSIASLEVLAVSRRGAAAAGRECAAPSGTAALAVPASELERAGSPKRGMAAAAMPETAASAPEAADGAAAATEAVVPARGQAAAGPSRQLPQASVPNGAPPRRAFPGGPMGSGGRAMGVAGALARLRNKKPEA